jgi:hypothetical protein
MAGNMTKLKVSVGKFVEVLGTALHSGRVAISEKLSSARTEGGRDENYRM